MRTRLSVFCDQVIEAGWLAAVIVVPLFFNIYSQRVFEPDKITLLRSIALVMSAAWLIRAAEDWRLRRAAGVERTESLSFRQKIIKTPLVLPTLFLVLVYLVSTAMSVVPRTSLWGSHVRLQGTYSSLAYIVIFFLMLDRLRTKKQLNRIITVLILVSFPIALYGLVQHFGLDPLPWGGNVTRRVTSSMGNAVFVAAYLIMLIPLTLTRLLENWKEAIGDFEAADGLLGLVSFVVLAGALLGAMFLGRSGSATWLSWMALLGGAVISAAVCFLRPASQRQKVLAISMPLTFAFLVGFVWVLEIPFPPANSVYFGWGVLASAVFLLAMVPFAFYLRRPVSRLLLLAGYFVILLAQLVAIFYSQSRGPQIGLLGSMLFFLVLLGVVKKRAWFSWLMTGLAAVAIVVLLTLNLVNSPFTESLRKTPYVGRLAKVFQTESGTGKVRILIWEGSAKMLSWHDPLEYPGEEGRSDSLNALRPIIGYGPESMYVAFNRFYPPDLAHFEKRNATPDRAHNDTFDALLTTGLLGLAAYLLLFISIFYYGFKWLGLIRQRWQRFAFVGLWVGGSIVGLISFWTWRGPAYIGVGLPFGGLVGLGVYTFVTLVQASRDPTLRQSLSGRYSLLILALLTAVTAHFIETQFGFGIAATRTYFWVYAALLVVVGWRLAAKPEETQELVAGTAATARQREPAPRRRRKRGAAPAARSQPRPDWDREWSGAILIVSIVAVLILSTMLFNYITVQADNPGVLATIWRSLTRSRDEPSFVMLLMFITTWVMIGLLGLSEVAARKEYRGKKAADWLAAVGVFALVSLGGAILFALLHAVRVKPIAITSADAPIPLADTITFFYVFLFLTMLTLALALALTFLSTSRQTTKSWKWTGTLGDITVVALLATLPVLSAVLIATTNVSGVRADILFKQGQGLERAKQYNAALFFYDKALALTPHEDYYYLFQARSFMDLGTASQDEERDAFLAKSEKAMLKAWEEAPLNTDHPRNLAKLYLAWGNMSQGEDRVAKLNKALDYSTEAMKLSPNNAQLVNERGQIYALLGDFEQAEEMYRHSLSLDEKYAQTYLLLGEAYMIQKKWKEAAQTYEKALEIKEKLQGAYRGLGYIYTQLGDMDSALEIYQRAVELWPKSFEDHKNLAIFYQQSGRTDEAIAEAQRALTLAPEGQRQSMENFLAQLGGAAQTASTGDQQQVTELMTKGQEQVTAEDWPGAEGTFVQVLEIDPANPLAHSMLAYVYARLGKLDQAITENLAVLDLVPDDYYSLKNLAILYQQKGDLSKAIEVAEQALTIAPESEKQAIETFLQQLKQMQGAAPTSPAEPGQRAGALSPAERNGMYSAPPAMTLDPSKTYQATIVTKKGNIVIDLAAAEAPQTVNNFVYLAREGFYDGVVFHRVENSPTFSLIQGGDPTGSGRGGPGYTVPAEIGLTHDAGAIAMARLGDQANPEKASSGSQFYIGLVPIHQLDGGYTVFGYVVEGLDVAQKISVGDEILTIVIQEQ